MSRTIQPGLFDDLEAEVYRSSLYVDNIFKDQLIYGDAQSVGEYVLRARRGGFHGDFNVWDYESLLKSYVDQDEALLRLAIPGGLELRLVQDSMVKGVDNQ